MPRLPEYPISDTAGKSSAGNADSSVPPTDTAVGTNTPMKPSDASGALTTPSERNVPVLAGMNGVASLYATFPRASVTLNTGAYPCPIRYTFVESTGSGSLILMLYVRDGAPGDGE